MKTIWRRDFSRGMLTPLASNQKPLGEPEGFCAFLKNLIPTRVGSVRSRPGLEAYTPDGHPATFGSGVPLVLLQAKYINPNNGGHLVIATLSDRTTAIAYAHNNMRNLLNPGNQWTLTTSDALEAAGKTGIILPGVATENSCAVYNFSINNYRYNGSTLTISTDFVWAKSFGFNSADPLMQGTFRWVTRNIQFHTLLNNGGTPILPSVYAFRIVFEHDNGELSPLGAEYLVIVPSTPPYDTIVLNLWVPHAIRNAPFNIKHVRALRVIYEQIGGVLVPTYKVVKTVTPTYSNPNPITITITNDDLVNAYDFTPPDNVDVDTLVRLHTLVHWKASMFTAWSDGIVRYTKPGTLMTIPSANWFFVAPPSEPIYAMVPLGDRLIIFTRDNAYATNGDINTGFTVEKIGEGAGIIGVHAYVIHEGILYWRSRDAIYRTNGVSVERISDNIASMLAYPWWQQPGHTKGDRHRVFGFTIPHAQSIVIYDKPNHIGDKPGFYIPTAAWWMFYCSALANLVKQLINVSQINGEDIYFVYDQYATQTITARFRNPNDSFVTDATDINTRIATKLIATVVPISEISWDVHGVYFDWRITSTDPSAIVNHFIYLDSPFASSPILEPGMPTTNARTITPRLNANTRMIGNAFAVTLESNLKYAEMEIYGMALIANPQRQKVL